MFESDINQKLKKISNKSLLTEDEIKIIINKLIKLNKDMIEKDIINRPERVEKFLTGQLMKETKGKSSPQVANRLIKKILNL
ncbi:MAG: hypothetical protein HRS50_02180 [Mycoplasmataceae bacterium]|nr:hypothetical protein [Mycoplasmataceae bacterium]